MTTPNNGENNFDPNNSGHDDFSYSNFGQNQDGQNNFGQNNYGQNNYGQNNYGQFPPQGAPNNFAQPQYGAGSKPDSYLVWTILATLLCCLPVGAVGIYFSTQVDSRWGQGDVQGAVDASLKAKKLTLWSVAAFVIGIILYVLLFVVIGAASFSSASIS